MILTTTGTCLAASANSAKDSGADEGDEDEARRDVVNVWRLIFIKHEGRQPVVKL